MIFIYLLILVVLNFYGFFNVLEEYRLPGIGKPSDFILLFISIIILFIVLPNKKLLHWFQKNKLIKLNLFIVIYMLFLIFYSSVLTQRDSFNNSLRVGGIFLYYISFLFPFVFLNNDKQFYNFILFMRISAVIIAAITITSTILGYSIVEVTFQSSFQGFIRIYIPRYFNYFVLIFWIISKIHRRDLKTKIFSFEAIISLLSVLLFFKRVSIITLLVMVLYVLFFFRKLGIKRYILVLGTILLLSASSLYFMNIRFDVFYERFLEGYENTMAGVGTFSSRLIAIYYGYNLFLTTPIFGTGFIRGGGSNYSYKLILPTQGNEFYSTTNNVDFGLPSILFTTGIIGFLLITIFIIKLFLIIKKELYKRKKNGEIDDYFTFALTTITITIFVFFIEQIGGNFFGQRVMVIFLIPMAISIKVLFAKKHYKNGMNYFE